MGFLDQQHQHQLGICKPHLYPLNQNLLGWGPKFCFNNLCRRISKFMPNFELLNQVFFKIPSDANILWIYYPLIWSIIFKWFKKNFCNHISGYAQFRQVKDQILRPHIPHIIIYVVSPNIYLNSSTSSRNTFKETLIKRTLRFIAAELYIILVNSWKLLNRCNNAFGIK